MPFKMKFPVALIAALVLAVAVAPAIASGLTIKKCRFENVGRAIYTDWAGSKDYYIADNVMIGRFNPDYLMGFTGRTWQNLPEFNPKLVSEYAVKVYGSGHVVAYNYIANFHDGVDVATYGDPDGSPNPIRERMPVSIWSGVTPSTRHAVAVCTSSPFLKISLSTSSPAMCASSLSSTCE